MTWRVLRLGGAALLALAVTGATGSARASMPTAQQCAAGTAAPATLGTHLGSAAVCASAAGHTAAYAGGNAAVPCGTVVLADQELTSSDPNACDSLLDLPPDHLDYNVVLPSDYGRSDARYPVLYLLTASDVTEWPTNDPHLQDIADLGVIIVLTDHGLGFYNDWADGSHRYETLYTRTLIDDVDARYRTIADREHRAVAGVSKAGYGAMLFAARHPDLYGVAASLSGIVDIARPGFPAEFSAQLGAGLATYSDARPAADNPIWGNPYTDEVNWHDKNPTDLATNLRGVTLYATAGDGVIPPDEAQASGPTTALSSDQEAEVRVQNEDFDRALTAAGIAHTYETHHGAHDFYFWVPQLHAWAPTMMKAFAHPAPLSATFDYRSADPRFSVWGWSFAADPRRAAEFLDVTGASSDAVTLTGSGLTTVTTAALFRPEQAVEVSDGSGHTGSDRADARGRLTFTVDLGPPHADQQYTPAERAEEAVPGYFVTRTVTLRPR